MSDEKVRILMVDDHEQNLTALTETLGDLDLEMVRALSGREALRHCLSHDFALVLLDVTMPEMDGFETARLLRQNDRFQSTPIVFITAYARSEAEMFQGYSLGAVDYIITPYDPHVLKAKVTRFVDLFRSAQAIKRQSEDLAAINQELRRQLGRTEQLNNDLEMANRQLDAFSYSVSHDLRAPLRTIDGFSRRLLEMYAGKTEDDGTDYLQRIAKAVQHMRELIEDMLALSRVTRAEIRRSRVDLSALAGTIVGELKGKEPERQVEFVNQSNLIVNGDERLLRVLLDNLLGNSWKFTAKLPKATMEFGSSRRKGKAVYFVRDNGAGFDMEHADRLFVPFQRLHSTQEFPGTGIGLSIVERIVSRHGGTVWGEGATGKGATFYFTIG